MFIHMFSLVLKILGENERFIGVDKNLVIYFDRKFVQSAKYLNIVTLHTQILVLIFYVYLLVLVYVYNLCL